MVTNDIVQSCRLPNEETCNTATDLLGYHSECLEQLSRGEQQSLQAVGP